MILLQYRRTKSNGGLELWVNENGLLDELNLWIKDTGKWYSYKESSIYKVYQKDKSYVAESKTNSTMSGFHLSQYCLRKGAKFLQITPENYKVPEDN